MALRPRVDVVTRLRRGASAVAVLRKSGAEFLTALGLFERELSVALIGDAAMRALNRKWRGKDAPTDVLSFPADEPRGAIGDVVISLDTAERQAREMGHPLPAELRRLLAHGVLHCLGHDHERPAQARKMARAEEGLLGREGLVGASLTAQR